MSQRINFNSLREGDPMPCPPIDYLLRCMVAQVLKTLLRYPDPQAALDQFMAYLRAQMADTLEQAAVAIQDGPRGAKDEYEIRS